MRLRLGFERFAELPFSLKRGRHRPKTLGALIATRFIEDGLTLLHADKDFAPFALHRCLREAYSDAC